MNGPGPVENPPEEMKVRKVVITINLEQVSDNQIVVNWDRRPNNEECKGKVMTMQMITALADLKKALTDWINRNDDTGVTSE